MSQKRSRVTLRDVADKAFVSVTTASEALRGVERVDPETRRRVAIAARELGYRTDTRARTLRSGKTARLTATMFPVLPEGDADRLLKSFWIRAHYSITQRLAQHNIANVWLPTFEPGLLELPIDALLVIRPEDESRVAVPPGIPFGLPTILLGGVPADDDAFTVVLDSDLDEAVDVALTHLKEAGAQHIVFLCTPQPLSPNPLIAQQCAVWSDTYGVKVDWHETNVLPDELIERFLDDGADAFLLLVDDDMHEVAVVLEAVKRAGKRIPEDVMLLSFAEGQYEALLDPPVTALSFEGATRGDLVADMIAEGLDTAVFKPPQMPITLSVRASTMRGPFA